MEIDVMKIILRSYRRKLFNQVRKHKISSILLLFIFGYFFINGKAILNGIDEFYYRFIPIAIYIYCIAKIIQEIPTLVIKPEFIELKILTVNKLKAMLILKAITPSILLMIYIIVNNIEFGSTNKLMFAIFIINMSSNLIGFIAYQIKYKILFKVGVILILSIGYYLESILISSIVFCGLLIYIMIIKSIKYGRILPYYKSISALTNGFIEGNFDSMDKERNIISGENNLSIKLLQKSYLGKYKFYFSKEISRLFYNKSLVINSCLISFLISMIVSLNSSIVFIKPVAFCIIIMIADNILSSLNKSESNLKKNGFYLPFNLKENIFSKILPHSLLTIIIIFSGVFFYEYINIYICIFMALSLPVKNIIFYFADKKYTKYFSYIISCLIYLIVAGIFI